MLSNIKSSTLCAGLSVFLLVFTFGCSVGSKPIASPGQLRSWERIVFGPQDPQKLKADRDVAQNSGYCLKDRLDAAQLRDEISERETEIAAAGTPSLSLSGKFSSFQGTSAAKQYVSRFQDSAIYSGNEVSFSGCGSIPCLINRIYGLEDSSGAGLEVYWFWLKTGYALAAHNKVPRISEIPGVGIQSYLFKKTELDAFWRLSHMLPSSFFRLNSLQTIHRLPAGYSFGMGNTCGIASGSRVSGDVRLSDNCLTLSSAVAMNPQDFFYSAVTHEITHRMDFLLGQSGADSYSDKEEWLALSGWRLQRIVKPGGGYEDKWTSDPTKEGFVRDYAGTSPAEDFAESAAYFRFRPGDLKRIAPGKSSLLRSLLYEGREFESQALLLYYRQGAEVKLRAAVPGLLKECFVPSTPGELNSSVEAQALEKAAVEHNFLKEFLLPEKITHCLSVGIYEVLKQEFDRLRFEEWEACDLLTLETERRQRESILQFVKSDFTRDLQDVSEMAPILAAQKELQESVAQEIDPRESALQCSYQSIESVELEQAKLCFAQSLSASYEAVGAPFAEKLGLDRYRQLREAYLTANSYERSLSRVYELYDLLFGQVRGFVLKKGALLWESCLASDLSAQPLDYTGVTRVTGGDQYVDANLLMCLNQGVEPLMDQLVLATLSRLGLGDPSPSARNLMVSRYLQAPLLQLFSEKIRVAAAAEESEMEQLMVALVSPYETKLLTDLVWLKLSDSPEARVASCQTYFWSDFSAGALPQLSQKAWRFATPAKVLERALEKICSDAVESPIAEARLRQEQLAYDREQLAFLDEEVGFHAKTPANTCLSKYVGTSSTYKTRRKTCLEKAWPKILADAVQTWAARPESSKVSGNIQSQGRAYLKTKSPDLFKKAVEAMEKGVQN